MLPELRLQPDRLREHARAAAGLADELSAALRGAPPGVEIERLQDTARAAASELEELAAALRGAAAAGGAADEEVSAALTRLLDVLERP